MTYPNNGDRLYYFPGADDDAMLYLGQPLAAFVCCSWEGAGGNVIGEPVTPPSVNLLVIDAKGETFRKEKIPYYHRGEPNPFYGKGRFAIFPDEWK